MRLQNHAIKQHCHSKSESGNNQEWLANRGCQRRWRMTAIPRSAASAVPRPQPPRDTGQYRTHRGLVHGQQLEGDLPPRYRVPMLPGQRDHSTNQHLLLNCPHTSRARRAAIRAERRARRRHPKLALSSLTLASSEVRRLEVATLRILPHLVSLKLSCAHRKPAMGCGFQPEKDTPLRGRCPIPNSSPGLRSIPAIKSFDTSTSVDVAESDCCMHECELQRIELRSFTIEKPPLSPSAEYRPPSFKLDCAQALSARKSIGRTPRACKTS